MTASASLLRHFEAIHHEATVAADVLNGAEISPGDARRLRQVLATVRSEAQTVIDWLSTARLEEPLH